MTGGNKRHFFLYVIVRSFLLPLSITLLLRICTQTVVYGNKLFPIDSSNPISVNVQYEPHLTAWRVLMTTDHQASLVIPQVCPTECKQSPPSTDLVDCIGLKNLIQSGQWMHDHLNFAASGCPTQISTIPAGSSAWRDAQLELAMTHNVYVSSTDTIIIIDDARINNLSSTVDNTIQMQLRVTFVMRVDKHALVAVAQHSFWLKLTRPETWASGLLSVEHVCTTQGFTAPKHASVELFIASSGLQPCVWKCTAGFMRYPHNKPPPLRNIATNLLCMPFPENFVAVMFTFDVEIAYAVPQFLTDVELSVFDEIAFQLAPEPPAFAVCKVPQSIYDDIDFHAAVLQAAEKQQGELEIISKNTGRRLLQSPGYVNVVGLIVTPFVQQTPNILVRQINQAMANIDLPENVLDIDNVVIHTIFRVSEPITTVTHKTLRQETSQSSAVYVVSAGVIMSIVVLFFMRTLT